MPSLSLSIYLFIYLSLSLSLSLYLYFSLSNIHWLALRRRLLPPFSISLWLIFYHEFPAAAGGGGGGGAGGGARTAAAAAREARDSLAAEIFFSPVQHLILTELQRTTSCLSLSCLACQHSLLLLLLPPRITLSLSLSLSLSLFLFLSLSLCIRTMLYSSYWLML